MEKTTQALLTGPGQPVRCDAPPIHDLPPQQTKVDATHICAAPLGQRLHRSRPPRRPQQPCSQILGGRMASSSLPPAATGRRTADRLAPQLASPRVQRPGQPWSVLGSWPAEIRSRGLPARPSQQLHRRVSAGAAGPAPSRQRNCNTRSLYLTPRGCLLPPSPSPRTGGGSLICTRCT